MKARVINALTIALVVGTLLLAAAAPYGMPGGS